MKPFRATAQRTSGQAEPAAPKYWLSRRAAPIGEQDRSDEGRGRTALVTGASSGIGWSLSGLLAAKGYDIVPVARRAERLDELKSRLEGAWSVKVDPIVADLGLRETPELIAKELDARGVTVDFLVNNAASLGLGGFTDVPWEEQLRFVQLV